MADSWVIGGAIGIVAGIVLAPVVAVPVAVALGVGGIAWASTAIGCGVVAGSMAIGTGIGVAIDANNTKTSSDETLTRNKGFLDGSGSGKDNKQNLASRFTKEVGANFTGGDAPKELNQNQSQTKENKARFQQKGVKFATKDGHPERIIGTPTTTDPLMLAIIDNDIIRVANITANEGLDIYDRNIYESALTLAAKYGSTEIVTNLIEKGAKVNESNGNLDYPLTLATQYGHTDVVKILINAGAIVDQGNRFNNTALMFAAQNGKAEIVDALIAAGADVNKTNKKNNTALMFAAQNGEAEIVNALIAAGADVSKVNLEGNNALGLATQYGNTEIAQILLKAGATKVVDKLHTVNDDDDTDKSTKLMLAVRDGNTEEVNRLIAKREDVNQKDSHGYNALMYAAMNNNAKIVESLIGAGASVDDNVYLSLKYNGGFTALMFASQMGHDEVVDALIEAKANVNKADKEGNTALMFAARNGDAGIVDALIAAGADVNQTNSKNETALMFAARNGDAGIFDALIEAKANVNKADKEGNTALMIADRNGHTDIVNLINAKLLATKTTSPSPSVSPSLVANSPHDRIPLTGSSTNQTPKGHNP